MSELNKLLEGVEVEWKTLGEVAIKISSGGTPNTGVSSYYGGNISWLRTQEVGYGNIWDTEIKITEEGLKNSSAKIIPENCVIVAMYGATVGKIGINKIPLSTNQACANIQLNEEIANYRYVYHFLLSQYEYIKSLGAGSQTNINAQIVKNLQIPIPPLPLLLQNGCYAFVVLFRLSASTGKDILFCNFWLQRWLVRIANVYGF